MNIDKTTLNYAKARNVDLFVFGDELHFTADPHNNECASVAYTLSDEQEGYSLLMNWAGLEDLPHWIPDLKKLREVITFVAHEYFSN